MKPRILFSLLVVSSAINALPIVAEETNQFPPHPPIPYLSPAEELKTFSLPPGYRLELVVSDPIIREPVVAVFDGDGKMFVAEMRTYMQDIDGNNQHAKAGIISLHWSSKRNGTYDKHTVFADNLLLPRMILPVADGGLLVNETDSNDIWLFRDTNRDGIADERKRIFEGGPRGGNLEHQQSGLIWNLDNWLYQTYNDYRLRLKGTNVLKESIPSGGGQWGMSHDDYGKPWFVNAGGEIGPLHFQQPIAYGRFSIKDELAPGYREVFPLIGLADVQGGTIRFRPADKTLNHLTASCGNENIRVDRLPEDIRGDLIYAEPVGRLIRRTKIEVRDGITYLSNPEQDARAEFIRSTDPNFRPVNIVNAPDGTLYILDMYRGIIQEGNWVREGSYLRKVVEQYQLDKNFGRGRIWRLVHEDFKLGKQPKMQDAKSSELIKHLEHPNGWWRDTAQKLLVLRADKSVVPALVRMVQKNKNHLARIHAIWTLEGLDALEPSLLRETFGDEHPQVRIAAIRASETLHKNKDKSLVRDIQKLSGDPDPNVVIQVLLTANLLKWDGAGELIESVLQKNPSRGVQEIGTRLIAPANSDYKDFTSAERKQLRQGESIYNDLCFACHGSDGKGMPLQGAAAGVTMAPPLGGSKTVNGHSEGLINVMLKGLSGPVNGKTYDAQMVAMESNNDEWIAAVASYVRNSFGNDAPLIRTNDVARVRAAFSTRGQAWTTEELNDVIPRNLTNRESWKVSASQNSSGAIHAIDGKLETRFDTGKEQVPGMWFQIELPEETDVCGLLLDVFSSKRDYPRKFNVNLSSDGKNWSEPVATGTGSARTTEITFAPAKTKFIRITQTGSAKGLFWSIHELQILQPPDQEKVTIAASKKAEASAFE